MTTLVYAVMATGLLAIEQLYVHFARRNRLFEVHTERSSHTEQAAVRGGGILFFVAAMSAVCMDERNQLYFLLGLIIVALISFLDDLYHVPKRYRLMAHATAIGLLLLQTGIFSTTLWMVIGAFIAGLGVLNMVNFMDGINSMTAFYGLATVGSLFGWQLFVSPDHPPILLVSVGIALVVFAFYNARKQAICFAGDVGSITLGFIIVYTLLELVDQQRNYLPLLGLAVYSVDTTLTLMYRLYNRQNIFQAHRLHLFQVLVHQKKYPHLAVAGFYAGLQVSINSLVFIAIDWSLLAQIRLAVLILAGLSIVYVVARKSITHKKRSALEADLSL